MGCTNLAPPSAKEQSSLFSFFLFLFIFLFRRDSQSRSCFLSPPSLFINICFLSNAYSAAANLDENKKLWISNGFCQARHDDQRMALTCLRDVKLCNMVAKQTINEYGGESCHSGQPFFFCWYLYKSTSTKTPCSFSSFSSPSFLLFPSSSSSPLLTAGLPGQACSAACLACSTPDTSAHPSLTKFWAWRRRESGSERSDRCFSIFCWCREKRKEEQRIARHFSETKMCCGRCLPTFEKMKSEDQNPGRQSEAVESKALP